MMNKQAARFHVAYASVSDDTCQGVTNKVLLREAVHYHAPQEHFLKLTAKSHEYKTATNSRETRDFKIQEHWSQCLISLKN